MSYNELVDQAIDYLKNLADQDKIADAPAFERDYVDNIAGLKVPKGPSSDQVKRIIELLGHYARSKAETKPISIALFGPPGSGKSTFVRRISDNVDGIRLVKTANMTQVNHSNEMADAFKNILLSMRETTKVPLVFFDEFDTMRDGTPLGWLSWFLSPMEDGVLLAEGQELEIGKAVFVFAGGTAETLDDFNRRAMLDSEAYRARKVPDFISRLRGAIDIGGINEHGKDRIIRRALALSYSLDGRVATKLDERKKLRPILEQGHFVHGVRSLKTVLNAEQAPGGLNRMEPVIRRQHFSRGKFDGLLIGISAGLEKNDGSQELTVALTERLIQSGATIAYAGAFFPEGTLDEIIKSAERASSRLYREQAPRPRIVNYLGYPASLNAQPKNKSVFEARPIETITVLELQDLVSKGDQFFRALPKEPNEAYEPGNHAAWSISLFRLRVRVMQDIDALVVCGGKDDGESWGRMSGIAEEVMIAVALGKPVYVLGRAGGAAEAVGKLLGLHDSPAWLDACLRPSSKASDLEQRLQKHTADFTIPDVCDSPTCLAETRRYLFNHGLSTQKWRDNGLSSEENRTLFRTDLDSEDSISVAVNLVLTGLGSVAWDSV